MVREKLQSMGVQLPPAPSAKGNYVTAKRDGNTLYISGQGPLPLEGGKPKYLGLLGREVSVEEGQQAARLSAIWLLAVLQEYADLDRVELLKLTGFIASAPGFDAQPTVLNGASDFFMEVFGEKGTHARSAVGMAALPFGIPVELELIVRIED